MDISSLQRAVKPSELPLDHLAGNTQISEEEKVREVSRQFEAILLRQILQEAQKATFHSTLQSNSVANSIYNDMIIQQLADGISKAGTLGLAESYQHQLSQQLTGAQNDSAAPNHD
jgi:Rod binding domain-containing protein